MEVRRYKHNTVVAVMAGKTLVFDPFLVTDEGITADVVFITHDHYDHFSPEDIKKVSRQDTRIFCPEHLAEACSKVLALATAADLQGLDVRMVPAYNIHKAYHKKGAGVGYLVSAQQETLYVAGDTDFIPEMEGLRCDVACLPIGGTYTMDAAQAAKAAETIGCKTVIPTHYGDIESVAGVEAAAEFAALLPSTITCLVF